MSLPLTHGPRLAYLALFLAAAPAVADAPLPEIIEYNRDVRPILSDTCYQCHGPDAARRKAGLRLDTEEGAKADRGGSRAVVPGDAAHSELVHRLTIEDEQQRMPPVKFAKRLTPRQVAILKRWVEQGAKWQKYWSFLPPRRPPQPRVRDGRWPRNGIDPFVLERLEHEGLTPSPEAAPETLIRRVTFDLTGLPPTPGEVDAFLADKSPQAYEKVVDRLLASPRFGERLAFRWLDAARYADSNGYQSDGERFMWRWRDWVIDAFNANMPFDRFTIEQLAGDLLPHPSLAQEIATGFNRNHRGNGEGGVIPEEYAVEYVADRVETTATVWLGLTLTCARCHDHKYDPVKQKEFYQLFAFFNNVPERGKAIKYGNSPPVLKSPTREQEARLAALDHEIAQAEAAWARMGPALEKAQCEWERSHEALAPTPWSPPWGEVAHFALDGVPARCTAKEGTPTLVSGRKGGALAFEGRSWIDAGDVGDFGFYDKFSLAAWVRPQGSAGGVVLSRMTDVDQGDGYSLHLVGGRLQVNLVKRWLDDAIRVQTEERLPADRWCHVLVSYDGSRLASGVKVYLDGRPARLQVLLDDLNQSFQTKEPFRIGAGAGPGARFHGAIQEVRVFDDVVPPERALVLAAPESINEILALAPARRSPAQAAKLGAWFLEHRASLKIRSAAHAVRRLHHERVALYERVPTTMVMEEMPRPRETFVLIRGEYDRRGEKVGPAVPAVLGALPAEAPHNRLGLARWLVRPEHPLTARVTVNRFWQMFFGVGLVKTAEDFGSQGEWPTHPELLDFLATEFFQGGWDIKALLRQIVTSATYRQSSRVTPALFQRDPENRLLARGPRVRLPAEGARDQALFISGLLAERLGGPSVKPYQPAGLWKELADIDYVPDRGEGLYRRSLYIFWKRTVSPTEMIAFDASPRETCVVRETRTNTPLQALTLLNDVAFVEAARALAQRVLREGGTTPEDRLTYAFRLATARRPRPQEFRVLLGGLREHLAHYRRDQAAALKLRRVGEAPVDARLDPVEVAAYAAVCSLILNLDEVVTKE